MVNSLSSIMYNVELLNKRNAKVVYSMSSGEALQYGSDNSQQFNKILSINNSVNSYSSLLDRIQSSTAYNTISDTATSNIKTSVESIQSLIIQSLNGTTNSEGKIIIANEIESLKNSIFTSANTSVDGQYVFSGKSSNIQTFEKDETTQKIIYKSSYDNKTINVEKNTYNTQGVNGIDLLYYPNQTAKNTESLIFNENEIITDENGNEYKLLDTDSDGNFDGLYLNGDSSNTVFPIVDNGDKTYTVTNNQNLTLESKHSIFDDLDVLINSLKQQDSDGNSITEDEASELLSSSLEKIVKAYDNINLNHGILGTRTSSINNYENIIQTKLTNFNILQETYSSADLTSLAIESQSLESTYTALYSTINKINNLSLVKYLS